MRRTPLSFVMCLGFLGAATAAVRGGAVQFQLGEQDFADGKSPVYSAEIREAGQGEAFPFDGTIFGHDVKASGLGAFEYLHKFDLGGRTPLAAMLTVGLIDIDSPPDRPIETIELMLDGVSQSAALLAGISALGGPSSVEVVDIPVPIELLADGKLNVSIAASRPGYGNLGNAVEADFSRLIVETPAASIVVPDPIDPVDPVDPQPPLPGPIVDPAPQPIPLPPMLIPAGVILMALAARRDLSSVK